MRKKNLRYEKYKIKNIEKFTLCHIQRQRKYRDTHSRNISEKSKKKKRRESDTCFE